MRRQQRILRHRYSKMLRRRATWERDSSPRFQWPFQMRGRWLGNQINDIQHLSSTASNGAKVEDRDEAKQRQPDPWAEFHNNYESFRKAVDKAIERDPYGTLFGRKLQSPPSVNNSSWTSFAWIFEPKEREDNVVGKKAPGPPIYQRPAVGSSVKTEVDGHTHKSSPAQSTAKAAFTDEYEYDPISMRKVPKIKKAQDSVLASDSSRKTFFNTLFGEHGVDIPVKTYSPPKVYGYGSTVEAPKKVERKSENVKKHSENSRKVELMKLKASTLGNNLDTTAEYYGKYKDPAEIGDEPQPRKLARDSAEPSDDIPLFAGTTYEDKSSNSAKPQSQKSDWLRTEGFSAPATLTAKDDHVASKTPNKSLTKMQPALDRVRWKWPRPEVVEPLRPSKLQFALDRMNSAAKEIVAAKEPQQQNPNLRDSIRDNKAEDVDLLRPSDVRAKTRVTGPLKQDLEQMKKQTRQKLEADYTAQQQSHDYANTESSLSKSMTHVWKHVDQYPGGIVARTMKSMGISEGNFKKYRSGDRPTPDLTKRLGFNDQDLSKVSTIGKKPRLSSKPVPSFLPSVEVMNAQVADRARRTALQLDKTARDKNAEAADLHAIYLGKEIKSIYESEYGTIDVEHRQPVREAKAVDLSTGINETKSSTPHPLQSATIKEGVPRYPEIEAHVSQFEPQFAKIIDQAKSVKRQIHDVKTAVRNVDLARADRVQKSAEAQAASVRAVPDAEEEDFAQGLDEPVASHKMTVTDVVSLKRVEEPVFAEHESAVWEDEQPPPPSELKSRTYTAPYVILAYDSKSKSIEISETSMLQPNTRMQQSPLGIISRLQHASDFLKHFSALEASGYHLVDGQSTVLVFSKINPTTTKSSQESLADKQNRIATEEAASQPIIQELPDSPPRLSFEPTESQKMEAAKVLDELPIDVIPIPGPAAPTAPPTSPATTSKRAPSPKPREQVRRQEDVFSGQIKSTSAPSTSVYNPIDPEIQSKVRSKYSHPPPKDGLFKRFARGVRRVLLTAAAFAGGAYAIGVVAEGIGAQEQQKRIAGSNEGPRRKVVMEGYRPGTRAGIYSTESSR